MYSALTVLGFDVCVCSAVDPVSGSNGSVAGTGGTDPRAYMCVSVPKTA